MFHYHIFTFNDNETVKKIYLKEKESNLKDDWYRTLKEDYDFIEEESNDEEIMKMSKGDFKKKVYANIEHSEFQCNIKKN